jgi:AcrR family transcriptional regulator
VARVRLSTSSIIESSLQLVDRHGFDALSLSAVATELGVGPSALYSHITGLEDLQYLVAVASTSNLVGRVRSAAIGTSGSRALMAMGASYRSFSLEHPGQFASTLLPPRSNDDELARQNRELLDVFIAVFIAMGIPDDEAYLSARATRSALHGFLALEHNSGTSAAHGAEYEHLLRALERGLLESKVS